MFEKKQPSVLERDDAYYMALAYNEALRAWKAQEVPVGAVIVRGDEVIGSAHNWVDHSKDPTAHAEILALTQASRAVGDWRLNGCTLFVTKEPCPMCAGATIMARLDRVVYAVSDPKMGCLGGATNINALPDLNHHVELTSGVLAQDCHALLKSFFQKRRS